MCSFWDIATNRDATFWKIHILTKRDSAQYSRLEQNKFYQFVINSTPKKHQLSAWRRVFTLHIKHYMDFAARCDMKYIPYISWIFWQNGLIINFVVKEFFFFFSCLAWYSLRHSKCYRRIESRYFLNIQQNQKCTDESYKCISLGSGMVVFRRA